MRTTLAPPLTFGLGLVGLGHMGAPRFPPPHPGCEARAHPLVDFRCGGSEMTEPGASPEDPWVKASPVGEHAGEGRAGRVRARRVPGR